MSGVGARTRSKPVKLDFRRSELHVRRQRGTLAITFDDLEAPLDLTWEEQARQLLQRPLARKLVVAGQNTTDARVSATSIEDRILKAGDYEPIIAVKCTEEIGVELELKVLVLLERSKEGGLTGKAAERPQTQGGFRQATNLPTGEHEVPGHVHEQHQLKGTSMSSMSSFSSGFGSGCGGVAGFGLGEELDSRVGVCCWTPPPSVGDEVSDSGREVGSATDDHLEASNMRVEEVFPHLLDALAQTHAAGGGCQSPAKYFPPIDVFDCAVAGGSAAGVDDNLFALSEEELAEASKPFVADTASSNNNDTTTDHHTATTTNNDNDNDDDDDVNNDHDHDHAAVNVLEDIKILDGSLFDEEEAKEGWKLFPS